MNDGSVLNSGAAMAASWKSCRRCGHAGPSLA